MQGSLKPTGKPCKKLIHRKGENMDNAVKAMGMEVERNFFTTVNTLLHEKLVYAETMIRHLRFIGELVDEQEASILSPMVRNPSTSSQSSLTRQTSDRSLTATRNPPSLRPRLVICTLKVSPLSRSSSLTSAMGGSTSFMYLFARCRKSR